MIACNRLLFVSFIGLIFASVSCSDAETPASPAGQPQPGPTAPAPAPPPEPTPAPAPAPAANPAPAASPSAADDPAALAARGSAVYTANCLACHNADPSLDGAIGPAIAGSSYELIEARVMRNEYPPGYKPKRETKAMIALPYLENDLEALTAFLNQSK